MKQDGFAVLFGTSPELESQESLQEQSLFSSLSEKSISEKLSPMVQKDEAKLPQNEPNTMLLKSTVEQIGAAPIKKASVEGSISTVSAMNLLVSSSKKQAKKTDSWAHLPLGNKFFSALKEMRVFVLMFLGIFCMTYFFNNAQLVFYALKDVFVSVNAAEIEQMSDTLMHNVAAQKPVDTLKALEQRFLDIQQESSTGELISLGMEDFINAKEKNHEITYNILPPTNRLIIPDLNINVPLVDAEANGRVDFSDESFDDELTQGVVKYPTTPKPGSKGNTLIFGHTSTEWWKKNPYGVVFRNIPKLKPGQRFQVIWNGQLTTYEMVERKVVLPKNVEEYYSLFADKGESYLTLMGCYPIGTADKRMMVVAKKVEN